MYRSLVKYLESSDIKDRVGLRFIDVTRDRIEDYPQALNLLKRKYAIPLVGINGIILWYGGIPYEMVYKEARKLCV